MYPNVQILKKFQERTTGPFESRLSGGGAIHDSTMCSFERHSCQAKEQCFIEDLLTIDWNPEACFVFYYRRRENWNDFD